MLGAQEASPHSEALGSVAWPVATQTARPWTRWWWHGSAVDEENLTRLLSEYHVVGLGGVEITCIYAVKNNQQRNRGYLSEEWIEALRHAVTVAEELGMGVDLPAGSGWRMGGPSVTSQDANHKLVLKKNKVSGGQKYSIRFEKSTPQLVLARDEEGEEINLTDQVVGQQMNWTAPAGDWTVYSLAYAWAGDKVKRPGPGGEGLNINPFAKRPVSNFLDYFGKTLERIPGIRAQFHDSFEYEGDWQPEFFEEFATRRGYRLESQLPALCGDGPTDTVARVKHDFRETLADLVLDVFIETWVDWSHSHNQLARNQSHGSPANWLDLYAACDIPEIESFGPLQGGDANFLILKFAASAANVFGHKLVSSETATWLDEHFNVTLAQIRQIVDRQILAGVNHVFYHGTAYSPEDAKWPGWLFYASTQLNPQNFIWRDFGTLNEYVTRCQSLLQQSSHDNDVLLYWPIHDPWHAQQGLRMNLQVHNAHDWFFGHSLGDAAELLQQSGYSFDYVSDRGLLQCTLGDAGNIATPGGQYAVCIVPQVKFLPRKTLEHLLTLAEGGAKIVFWQSLPHSEPGMAGASASPEWNAALAEAKDLISKDKLNVATDLLESLRNHKIRVESHLKECKLDFLRKHWRGRPLYFIRNGGDAIFDDSVSLAESIKHAVLMDPMSGYIGLAKVNDLADGGRQVRLQLAPGETVFLYDSKTSVGLERWPYQDASGPSTTLPGPWRVEFVEGGPTLPEGYELSEPAPWTDAEDPTSQNFAGTVRYSTTFDRSSDGDMWLLELGEVLGSARVVVNGNERARLISPPYSARIQGLNFTGNRLEIEVTGVAANRIRDLDRRGVEWKIFEDINFVDINYQAFDASDWPVRPLGLKGPVTLTPSAY